MIPQGPSQLVVPLYDNNALDGTDDNNAKEVIRESYREPKPRNRPADVPQYSSGTQYPSPDIPVYTFGFDYPRPSVVKNYTVNLNNPLTAQSLEVVNAIYQDYLLPSVVGLKYSTLRSREALLQVVRNVVLGGVDGEEVHLASPRHHSLMTQLKLLEAAANPLRSQLDDPYRNNPFDTVIVRCGYPIRYQTTGQISLAKENISMNIRLYRLDNAEYRYPSISFFNELDMIPWRELLFYQMIGNKVVEKKKSPHFPRLYGYFLCKSSIRFDTFNINRKDHGRLARFKQNKIRKYAIKLADNERNLGTTSSATVVVDTTTGTPLSGGGVIFYEPSTDRIMFRRVPSTNDTKFKLPIGPLETLARRPLTTIKPPGVVEEIKRMIVAASCKAFGYNIRLTPDMLEDSKKLDVPMDGTYKYRVYVVPVKTLPLTNTDTLAIEKVNIRPSSALFEERTKKVLDEAILKPPPVYKKLPPHDITPIPFGRIVRSPVSEPWSSGYIVAGSLHYPDTVAGKPQASPLTAEGLSRPSGLALGLLTESPTHNLLQWCSKSYTSSRNVIRKMTRLGIYQDEVWRNILFQMLQGITVMMKEKFAIRNMALEKSVFIKDLQMLSNQYWIYNLNGMEYYLPHAGYLVLYDIGGSEEDDFESKVVCHDWGRESKEEIETILIDGILRIFDPTFFNAVSLPPNVNPPSKTILNEMKLIRDSIDKGKTYSDKTAVLTDTIRKHFSSFFHPRIGSDLTEQEVKGVEERSPRWSELKYGSIVAYMKSYTPASWVWVYFVAKEGSLAKICVRKNGKDIEEKNVSINLLRRYLSPRSLELFSSQPCITQYSYDTCLEYYTL